MRQGGAFDFLESEVTVVTVFPAAVVASVIEVAALVCAAAATHSATASAPYHARNPHRRRTKDLKEKGLRSK
jgi:hypothetical protein